MLPLRLESLAEVFAQISDPRQARGIAIRCKECWR